MNADKQATKLQNFNDRVTSDDALLQNIVQHTNIKNNNDNNPKNPTTDIAIMSLNGDLIVPQFLQKTN